MGVTTAELNKMLENGEVISDEFLPKFAKELNKTFKATPEVLEGPDKAIQRMKNSFALLAKDLGDAGLNEAIVNITNSLTEFAKSDTAKSIVDGLGKSLILLSENIDSVIKAFSVLAAGLATKTIVNTIKDVGVLTKGLSGARTEALSLGGAFNKLGILATVATASFQFGDILVNQFNEARIAGSYLLQSMLNVWEGIKLGAQLAWNGISLIIKTVLTAVGGFFLTAANGWLMIFEDVAGGIDRIFGSDLTSKLKPAREALDSFINSADDEALAQLKTETEAMSKAMDTFNKNTAENNRIFNEQQDLFYKQGTAAEKAKMTIGEYLKSIEDAEKALAKKAKEDAKAIKSAKDLAEAEKSHNAAVKAKKLMEAKKELKELREEYDDQFKAIQKLAESEKELAKFKKLGLDTTAEYILVEALLNEQREQLTKSSPTKAFEEQLDIFIKQRRETVLLTEALKEYKDVEVAQAVTKGKLSNLNKEQIQTLVTLTKNQNKLTKEQKKAEEQAKRLQKASEFDFGDAFEDASVDFLKGFEGIGDDIGQAISTGDWDGIGRQIGGLLSGSIGDLIGTTLESSLVSLGSLAGPIGGLVGGLADSVLNTFISEGFSGTLFGDVEDPTERRQRELGTGTILGDDKAQSESIVKSLNIISNTNQELVNINTGMLKSLSSFSDSINTTISTIAGIDLGAGIAAPTANTDIGNALAGGITLGIPNMGSIATDFLDAFSFGLFSALGDLLGGKVKKLDEGVQILGGYLTDLTNNTVVEAFATFKEKKHAFDDYDQKERSSRLDQGVSDQFTSLFVQIADTVATGAETLGLSTQQVEDIFSNFEIDTTKISLEGLDVEGQAAALNTYFSSVFDELTLATIPWLQDLQMAGEGLGETLARVSTNFMLGQEALSVLGFQVTSTFGELWGDMATSMIPFGEALKDVALPMEFYVGAANDLVEKTGGAEAFSQALSSFEQNFLSSSEQIDNQGRRLSEALAGISETLPETRGGFKELLQTQDAMTESGRQNIATLLNLQGAADSYYGLLESQTENLANIRDLELRLMQAQGDEAGLLAARRQDELDALEGLANADEARELLEQIWELEDAAAAAAKEVGNLGGSIQDMVSAAVDAFFKIDFQAFNVDGSDLLQSQIDSVSQTLVNGVGGISEFNSAVNSFANNFISDEAKFTKSSDRVAEAFAKYNAVIPATREGFTSLVQSLNAIAGPEVLADALKIAEDAHIYYTELEARSREAAEQQAKLFDLETRLLKTQGKELQVLARTRQKELEAATASEQAILRQIYAAEDLASKEAELTSEVADVQERLNEAYREQISNLEDTASRMRGLNESLMDFGTDLALGDMSTLSPQEQLALARSQFESTASAAQSGDINALERLQSVAQAFLEESREFQGSGGTYADDFARVQDVISTSASIADIQADQAERQAMLMERQLERQTESLEETRSIKEALLALIAVQKESGILSLSELEAMKSSLAILESNSSLSSSQL